LHIKRIAFYALIQWWLVFILVLGSNNNIHIVFFSFGIHRLTLFLILIWLFFLIINQTLGYLIFDSIILNFVFTLLLLYLFSSFANSFIFSPFDTLLVKNGYLVVTIVK
jgi:hypothetical protein